MIAILVLKHFVYYLGKVIFGFYRIDTWVRIVLGGDVNDFEDIAEEPIRIGSTHVIHQDPPSPILDEVLLVFRSYQFIRQFWSIRTHFWAFIYVLVSNKHTFLISNREPFNKTNYKFHFLSSNFHTKRSKSCQTISSSKNKNCILLFCLIREMARGLSRQKKWPFK